MGLTNDEAKALDIMLTAERNYHMKFMKNLNGAFCSIETQLDDEYINVFITHGVQNDAEDRTEKIHDRIVRATMKWEKDFAQRC